MDIPFGVCAFIVVLCVSIVVLCVSIVVLRVLPAGSVVIPSGTVVIPVGSIVIPAHAGIHGCSFFTTEAPRTQRGAVRLFAVEHAERAQGDGPVVCFCACCMRVVRRLLCVEWRVLCVVWPVGATTRSVLRSRVERTQLHDCAEDGESWHRRVWRCYVRTVDCVARLSARHPRRFDRHPRARGDPRVFLFHHRGTEDTEGSGEIICR